MPEAQVDLADNLLTSGGGLIEPNPFQAYQLYCEAARKGNQKALKTLKEKDQFQLGQQIIKSENQIRELQEQVDLLKKKLSELINRIGLSEITDTSSRKISH